jgi:hypothetical protein
VWQGAFSIFVAHAPVILLVTSICIAGPAILCHLVSAALGHDEYAHASGPLATWEGIKTLNTARKSELGVVLLIQAGLGMIGLAFARGVVARLVLGDADGLTGLAVACREAKARFWSLLIGLLIYGVVVTSGAVGVNGMLRDTGFDLRHVGRRDVTAPARVLALRTLDALVPSPGSPLAEFVPLLRRSSFTDTTRLNSIARSSADNGYWQHMSEEVKVLFGPAPTPVAEDNSPVLAISLTSLVALLLAEALLRFAPIMTMNSDGQKQRSVITPVFHSIGFGLRHFGTITKHVWLMRLAFVAAYSVFFMLPVVLSQDVLPPVMTNAWKSVTGSWPVTLTLICYWLVIALFTAFSTVYDVRLYAALALKPSASANATSIAALRGKPICG